MSFSQCLVRAVEFADRDECRHQPEGADGEAALALAVEAVVGLLGPVAKDEGSVGEVISDGEDRRADPFVVGGQEAEHRQHQQRRVEFVAPVGLGETMIDDTSPLRQETSQTLAAHDAMFMLSLSGTDETTGQVLKARGEYQASAVRWNATFRDILDWDGNTLHIDYSKFHDVDPLAEAPSPRPPP